MSCSDRLWNTFVVTSPPIIPIPLATSPSTVVTSIVATPVPAPLETPDNHVDFGTTGSWIVGLIIVAALLLGFLILMRSWRGGHKSS
jgi:hypothetical protein